MTREQRQVRRQRRQSILVGMLLATFIGLVLIAGMIVDDNDKSSSIDKYKTQQQWTKEVARLKGE